MVVVGVISLSVTCVVDLEVLYAWFKTKKIKETKQI